MIASLVDLTIVNSYIRSRNFFRLLTFVDIVIQKLEYTHIHVIYQIISVWI